MNENGLIERTPEEEQLKDIRIALFNLQKDLERVTRDLQCLYEVLNKNFYKEKN